ncbi:MAG: acetate kinase [Cyanobacteria bacterium]|nr:acetate kinase [Cyanobacteriota bacterium]
MAFSDPALVLNAGSSSLKARLLAADGQVLWQGRRDGAIDVDAKDLWREWLEPALGPAIESLALVGHRVVHGGDRFVAPTRLTPEVLAELTDLVPLAPLHNGPSLRLMAALAAWRPQLPQWACFDTAFHRTLPEEARTYALPEAWRQQGLRRFGFHGLNHQHISEVMARHWAAQGRCGPLRLISCHLGAGCSLCAIAEGRSVATTMGFTPLDGLVMATRCGAIDPGLVLHQLRAGVDVADLENQLNTQSGLLGLSGWSADMAELRKIVVAGETATDGGRWAGARRAIAVFRHSLLQGIGAMAASLGGVDGIAFSGGIGEHDGALRQEVIERLAWLQPLEVLVVPADEEGLIARLCRQAAALGPTTPAPAPADSPR